MKIYDNEGLTFDRYTIIDHDGSIYNMSKNALSPQGVNMCIGSLPDFPLVINKEDKPISFDDLPDEVQTAITLRQE